MLSAAALIISLALMVFVLFDVIGTDPALCRSLPKPLWILLIILLPTLGSIAWLLLGRPERTMLRPGDTRYRAPRPIRPIRPTRRPLGPDDDPRWQEDLRRREEKLRRDEEGKEPPVEG